jgi:L-amino acid N-acyltransferase YncA
MRLRDCTREDIPAVAAIYAHHVLNSTATFEELPPTVEDMAARYDAVRALGTPYIVAEIDGRVAGYSSATIYRARSAYRYTLENAVYIDGNLRGTGLGRALLGELLPRCEALGYRQMIAVIGDSENHASIGLHAAMGFERVAFLRSVGFKFGRWLDSILMQRALGLGDANTPTAC